MSAGRPLGRLWRPSAFAAFSNDAALEWFAQLPGPLGFVRMGLGRTFATTIPENVGLRLREYAHVLQRLTNAGAQLIVTLGLTPPWLSPLPTTGEVTAGGAPLSAVSVPRDMDAWRRLCRDVARGLRELGLGGAWLQVWNEPDSPDFWRGTREQLFELYAGAAIGACEGNPDVRIGGMSWGGPESPSIPEFLRFVGERGLPLHFIDYHCYSVHPTDGMWGPEVIRGYLNAAGLASDLPQLVTEWCYDVNPHQPKRDTAEVEAYDLAVLHEFDRQGVHGHTRTMLQDQGPREYGGYGVITRDPLLEKPSARVLHRLAQLGALRLEVDTSSNARTLGVDVIATHQVGEGRPLAPATGQVGAGRPQALVSRWDPSGPAWVEVQVRGAGVRGVRLLGRSAVELF